MNFLLNFMVQDILNNFRQKHQKTPFKENFKSKYINYVDIKEINSLLENLQKIYNDIVSIPSPKDIFSDEDYNVIGDEIVLESLNNIPSVFEQYLNIDSVVNYFEQGNILKTRYIGPKEGWKLTFEGKLSEYGTNVSSDEEKFKIFVDTNKDFITSVYEATSSLVGDKVIIKQNYISQILGI